MRITPELLIAALSGPVALAEVNGKMSSSAMVVVPDGPPGRNVSDFIRRSIGTHSRMIVAVQGARDVGRYERMLRASLPDCESKVRVMAADRSLVQTINSAEANKMYSKGQVLQVFCPQDMAAGFSQEASTGAFDFDPTVIQVNVMQVPSDNREDIERAVESGDHDAMHRVLDPHVFSDGEAVARYQSALMGQTGMRIDNPKFGEARLMAAIESLVNEVIDEVLEELESERTPKKKKRASKPTTSDDHLLNLKEFGTSAPASGADGPAKMRGTNSSSWAGGRGVLKNQQNFVPTDDNESERDRALDQDVIVGGGLDWGRKQFSSI